MINLSPSKNQFFKIDAETNEELKLNNVGKQNNILFTSISPIVRNTDSIKIIYEDGYVEIRKVKQSIPHTFVGRQEIILR